MTHWAQIQRTILYSLLIALCPLIMTVDASAQSSEAPGPVVKHFHGLYGGLEVSRQNVIGGALIGGQDVLRQETRLVTSAIAGARGQFANNLVFGAEVTFGFGDQDLTHNDPAAQTQIRYANGNQWSYGAQFGYGFGPDRRTLVFVYVSEVTRSFDVAINSPAGQFRQSDEQGLLRFGIGLERQIAGGLHGRLTIGSSRADFDGRATNIDVDRPFEVGGALLYQF